MRPEVRTARPPRRARASLIGGLLSGVLVGLSGAAQALEVRVGVYENPPKLMLGERSVPSGILGDLIVEIGRQEGWRIRAVPCEWERCLTMLEAGEIDLMPDVAPTEARTRAFDFHRVPALNSWSQIYTHEGQRLQSILELQDRRVAVLEGSIQHAYLTSALKGFGVRAQLIGVDSLDAAFAAVRAGRADAAVANHYFGAMSARRYGLVESSLMFQPTELFYAAGKGRDAALLSAIDQRLAPWREDPGSAYFRIQERWAGGRAHPSVPPAVWWGLAALSTLLVLTVGAAALLRREVARRTTELRQSQDRLSTILDSVEAYIFIKDTGLRYQYVNRKVAELFGRPPEEIVGRGDAAFFDAVTAERLRTHDRAVLQGRERQVFEEENRTHTGEVRTFLSVKLPLVGRAGEPYALCGISTDITDQRRFLREIHELAYHDPLTHLPNRRQMMERLQDLLSGEAEAAAPSHALLLVNLDGFKDVNDAYGPGAGDQLLRQAAQRLVGCARAGDLVARLGADEFGVLTGPLGLPPAHSRQQLETLAARLSQAIGDATFRVDGVERQASVCIGIALIDDQHASAEAVLKQADLALSRAKSGGRGQVRFFLPEMETLVAARAALEADLRQGLAQQQFRLFYQPQVDLDGRVCGYEALVRWQHPTRGLVLPDGFIGLAEASGLIGPLGGWILRAACRQLVAWQGDPRTAHAIVAVNMSARQVHRTDFVDRVLGILADTGASPERLELELTESHLVEDLEGVIRKMAALKDRGVRISLDDFGTGYSSLSHVRRLPLDQLKIDQSFIRDLLIDPTDLSIVRAIIEMGRSLGLEVLAEGVETPAQRDLLVDLGCTRFQGYLFGRPTAIEA